ncbi:DEAD/DEAH box helicase family protein [Photobacterium toruni]|uniref:DEAD/DEAH box helicase family protein n=1 Tax=Photobacterium toruni TaxID=1935446 RepID=UPI002110C7E6|nr:DEAD/DEAH box helicase family protein [Photobacterium toruni]
MFSSLNTQAQNVKTIVYGSGQTALFFGDDEDLNRFTDRYNSNHKKDYILTAAKDFLLSSALTMPTTPSQRFKANVIALKILKTLRERNSAATLSEQQKLASYCGWGAIASIFDNSNKKESDKRDTLKLLMNNDQYIAARKSTTNAFYTPHFLSKALFKAIEKSGFNGGNIVDPCAGVGGLINAMPQDMLTESNLTLVELDDLSSEILEHLYPSAKLYAKTGFESLQFKSNTDLLVINPPFGSDKVFDVYNSDLNGLTIHNYFMCKAASLLRDGGLMAAIVTTSFLDAKNPTARTQLAKMGRIVSALRLPIECFKNHAGANASVDVIIFQRDENINGYADWINTQTVFTDTNVQYEINNFFINNPDQVLGEMVSIGNFAGKGIQCVNNSTDLVGDIQTAIKSLIPDGIYKEPNIVVEKQQNFLDAVFPIYTNVTTTDYILVGGYSVNTSNDVCIRIADSENGEKLFEVCQEITGKRAERIKLMIPIKQILSKLLEKERLDNASEQELNSIRNELNNVYDAFTSKFGFINESTNKRAFNKDPSYTNIAALELNFECGVTKDQAKRLGVIYTPPKATKAAIFSQRVISPFKLPTHTETALDALWITYSQFHTIDLNNIGLMCGKSETDVKKELLGSTIFKDPQTNLYIFKDSYLSGDVKTKLKIATESAKTDSQYLINCTELTAIQPKEVNAIDIKVDMNAGWLPKEIVCQFICETLNAQSVEAEYLLGIWNIKCIGVPYLTDTQRFGLPNYTSTKIITRMMQSRNLIVTYTIDGKRYVNKDETVQVEGIASEIRTLWQEWVWKDKTRRSKLQDLYNERFNRWVKPQYDGSMLTLPDMNESIKLRKHQLTCVRRALEQPTLLADLSVGSGKTYMFSTTCHEWHRLGLKKRTAVVIPNHLVEQVAREWLHLYPTEQLLVLSTDDMSSKNRISTLNKIKTGSKIVIIPQSTFKAIPLPVSKEKEILEEEIEATRDAVEKLSSKKFNVKKMETSLKNLEFKLNTLINRKAKTTELDFEDLLFDSIIADEAQSYKNLQYQTVALSGVRGLGNSNGSQLAFDMYCKIRFLSDKYEHAGVLFSTGTPISNSIAEIFTVQRFLDYKNLKNMGLHHLDAWANLYASVTSEFEISPSGTGFKPTTRLRAFNNLPELSAMYGCIAETVTASELNEYLPCLDGGYPMIPPLKGGKAQTIFVDPCETQKYFIDKLADRAKDFRNSPINNDNMLLVMYHARCASLDMRILDSSAPVNSNSKVIACADKVKELYTQYNAEKGTQIVFCDLSVPNKDKKALKAKIIKLKALADNGDEKALLELDTIGFDQIESVNSNFSIYDDLKQELLNRNIPENEIAFAQDYRTPLLKEELHLQLNSGVKRVVIASTTLLGTGANINKKGVAVHMLDPTYKPSDMEQRAGRIIRQGNTLYESDPANFKVNVIYYATRNSLDSFLYQTLENKSKWIEAFRTAKLDERTISDIASDSLTFAEIKAEISGNVLILEHLQLNKEITKLETQQKRHSQQQHHYQDSLSKNEALANRLINTLKDIESDIQSYEKAKNTDSKIINATFNNVMFQDKKDVSEHLFMKWLDFRYKAGHSTRDVESGNVLTIAGFNINFEKTVNWNRDQYTVNVTGKTSYSIEIQDVTEIKLINVVMSILNNLTSTLEFNKRLHEDTLKDIVTANENIGKEFIYLDKLIGVRKRLVEVERELIGIQEDELEQKQKVA